MARVPTLRRLNVEDFKDQKTWIGKLFDPLNQFLTIVTSALTNQLTQSANMDAQIVTISISTTATLTDGITVGGKTLPPYATLFNPPNFKCTTKNKPQGVMIWKIDDNNGTTLVKYGSTIGWTYQDGQIFINHVSGLEPSHTYNLVLWVSGG